ncbi:hypothetical protein KY290_011482 [Solanum tuberosum]|uniref:Uncharacterized protein n=1 Tax=Solanum tuberosum TaxID=4113 RepID=A0ABQ7W2V2_SOLTU|nr:hypothetical protein KY284_011586 [Solanum tuberosum]KAH0774345.1 hypothetical protein KY290_011482 [Solanum tuberosum]
MEHVVNPGPIDRTLLLSQHEHKSELLWKGEISFSCFMRTVHMNDAWNLFRLHQPQGRVEEILRRSGLYREWSIRIYRVGVLGFIVTTLSPLSSPDVTFIMPVDDMPQTPGRKKVVKRIVKNVNIKDLLAKKRKRDNEDEDGYTGLRPRDVLRISRKGCGT